MNSQEDNAERWNKISEIIKTYNDVLNCKFTKLEKIKNRSVMNIKYRSDETKENLQKQEDIKITTDPEDKEFSWSNLWSKIDQAGNVKSLERPESL